MIFQEIKIQINEEILTIRKDPKSEGFISEFRGCIGYGKSIIDSYINLILFNFAETSSNLPYSDELKDFLDKLLFM